jgi:Tol biopolymer transport system component
MAVDWTKIKSTGPYINILSTNQFATKATTIPGVSTLGWEDSASVNWAGNAITFTYFRADPFYYMFFGKLRLDGPVRAGWPKNGDMSSEIYIGTNINGNWTCTNVGSPINTPDGAEGCQQLTEDGKLFYFSRSWGGNRALFCCDWNNGKPTNTVMLPAPINDQPLTTNTADNPFLCNDGKTFLFEKGPANNHKIYCSIKSGNTYTPPFLIPTINEDNVDITQPWMSPDGQTMLYSRNHYALMMWKVNEPVSATNPKPLVTVGNHPNAAAIGEPTMDKNGNLYFVYVYKADDGAGGIQFDADVCVLKKRTSLKAKVENFEFDRDAVGYRPALPNYSV